MLSSVQRAALPEYEEDYCTKSPYSPYQDFERHGQLFERFITMLAPKSVLDVGCAYGYIVKRCLDIDIFAVGLDISTWCSRQLVIPGHYIIGTAWMLPFKTKAFDVLFCEGALEHIPENKIELLMAEFGRVSNRRMLGITYDTSYTPGHICNHDADWWFSRVPVNTLLGKTGRSLDREDEWLIKTL